MQFKFICLNTWHGGRLWDQMVQWLQDEKPDVLALQEAYHGEDPSLDKNYRCVSELSAALGLPHIAFAETHTNRLTEGRVPKGNAVLSCFPLTERETVFYDVPHQHDFHVPGPDYSRVPRNLQHVTLTADGDEFHLFNTQGIWGFHGRDTKRRTNMINLVRSQVEGLQRVLVCGDFNVDQDSKAIASLGEALVDVFGRERTTSFNMRRKDNPGYASAVVDFIFVSPTIEVVLAEQPDVDVSDHLPLVCRLTPKVLV